MIKVEIPLLSAFFGKIPVKNDGSAIGFLEITRRNLGHWLLSVLDPQILLDMSGSDDSGEVLSVKELFNKETRYHQAWQGEGRNLGKFNVIDEPWSHTDPILTVASDKLNQPFYLKLVAGQRLEFRWAQNDPQTVFQRIDVKKRALGNLKELSFQRETQLLNEVEIAFFGYLLYVGGMAN